MKIRLPLYVFSILIAAFACHAEVRLNKVFTDHMVLQRDIPVKIFGTGDVGELVTIQFGGQKETTRVKGDGHWLVKLKAMPANKTPRKLRVNDTSLSNILVGDVWMCAGQSNMAGMLRSYIKYGDGTFKEFRNEPGDYRNDEIRFFTVPMTPSDAPLADLAESAEWQVCTPDSAVDFSCAGYFFGKYLQPQAGVPIGLIKSAVGGTGLVSWLPLEAMENNPVAERIYLNPYRKALERYSDKERDYQDALAKFKAKSKTERAAAKAPQVPMGPNHFKRPAALYNGMISPLHNLAIKGAIWYQGENEGNGGRSEEYKTTFPLIIETWRQRWSQGNFPFIFVQLAAFRKPQETPSDPQWARLRDAQLYTLKTVPATGMAVAIDGGLVKNIHPPYKELVGKRLAAEALRVAYGSEKISQGPLYKSMKVNGNQTLIRFDNVGSGLEARDRLLDAYGESPIRLSGKTLKGFTIAGEDRVFHPAKATIQDKLVVVESKHVKQPVAVRYAWAEFPLCNLYNKEGFAAPPFRTDDWPASGK